LTCSTIAIGVLFNSNTGLGFTVQSLQKCTTNQSAIRAHKMPITRRSQVLTANTRNDDL